MVQILLQMLYLFIFDAIFLGLFALLLIPLALKKRAAFAVLRRNFVGYFSNPTGYVFLCLFVLLTSFAAFWREWLAGLATGLSLATGQDVLVGVEIEQALRLKPDFTMARRRLQEIRTTR